MGERGLTRRAFLRNLAHLGGAAAGLGLLAGCRVATGSRAEGADRTYRVGLISASPSPDAAPRPDFWSRLRELGYVEGRTLLREERIAVEDRDEFADFATELARLPVDVIVTFGIGATRAAMAATTSIPIVMVTGAATEPDGLSFPDPLGRPGPNVTGVAGASAELALKRFQLFVEAAPAVSRVAVLVGQPSLPEGAWESAARSLGVGYVPLGRPALARDGLESTLARAASEGADGLLVQQNADYLVNADLIVTLAARYGLPAMYPTRQFVARGGLMSYEARGSEIERQAADYVDRTLRGTRPSDLPIDHPTRYDLIINMKAARTLGLTFPALFLAQVDEVIE